MGQHIRLKMIDSPVRVISKGSPWWCIRVRTTTLGGRICNGNKLQRRCSDMRRMRESTENGRKMASTIFTMMPGKSITNRQTHTACNLINFYWNCDNTSALYIIIFQDKNFFKTFKPLLFYSYEQLEHTCLFTYQAKTNKQKGRDKNAKQIHSPNRACFQRGVLHDISSYERGDSPTQLHLAHSCATVTPWFCIRINLDKTHLHTHSQK